MKKDTLYLAGNGEVICINCAGNSARETGYDIDGSRVIKMGAGDVAYVKSLGHSASCTCGKVSK